MGSARGVVRSSRASSAALVALAAGGCSALVLSSESSLAPDCTDSRVLPVVDTVASALAVVVGMMGLTAAAAGELGDDELQRTGYIMTATGVVGIAGFGMSADYGDRKVERCRLTLARSRP